MTDGRSRKIYISKVKKNKSGLVQHIIVNTTLLSNVLPVPICWCWYPFN